MQKLTSLIVIALLVGLSFRFQSVAAPGFGSTCLNRHDASFKSVLIHAPAVNYTGAGDEVLAAWLWGYDITVVFNINQAIMMNAQPDMTNGSIFFATNMNGNWHVQCYYNIGPSDTLAYFQFHPANLTGFENSNQLVTLSTGDHKGQYNVSWIGP